jgi:putative hydrolase of the HAD superfamily
MIHGIFFDIGWTMERPATDDWYRTRFFYEAYPDIHPDRFDPETFKHACMKAQKYLGDHHDLHSLQDEEDVFTQYYLLLVSSLPGYAITPKTARQLAHDAVYDEDKYLLLGNVPETLALLKQQGYRLGIISDTFPSIVPQLTHVGLLSYFDCTTYSFALNTFKPDPRMYRDALSKMGLPAEETVFIDDLPGNLKAAEALGMHGIQSLANPAVKPDPAFPAIHEPSELPALLEQLNRQS